MCNHEKTVEDTPDQHEHEQIFCKGQVSSNAGAERDGEPCSVVREDKHGTSPEHQ